MRRLRVTLVVPGFPRTPGEPGLPAVVDLVERLAADVDVRVVALRHPTAGRYELGGLPVEALGRGRAGGARRRAQVLAAGMQAVVRSVPRPDVVHGLWADEPGAVAVLAGRLLGRRSIVSVMGGELAALPDIAYGAALGRGGRWSTTVALGLADLVTAGSSLGLDAVTARRSGRPVALRPLGVDTSRFAPAAAGAPEKGSLLFAGSLEPVKDPALLLRAAAGLPGAATVTFAGDGTLRRVLERSAADLGLGKRVRFLGHVARRDMPAVYRSAAVLAITSRHEGQSMVALEAAACGLPVVGARVGALPDLGDGAVRVEPGDEAALREALGTVLRDEPRRAAMSVAGRAVALERFDLARTSADVLADYERLATRRAAR